MEGYGENYANRLLGMGMKKAEETLSDRDSTEELLRRLEEKLKIIPAAGKTLSRVPLLISLLRSWYKKEYTTVPLGSVLAVTGALIYWLSPIDLIPDSIPVAGYTDDARVVAACLRLIEDDLKEYRRWRDRQDKK